MICSYKLSLKDIFVFTIFILFKIFYFLKFIFIFKFSFFNDLLSFKNGITSKQICYLRNKCICEAYVTYGEYFSKIEAIHD